MNKFSYYNPVRINFNCSYEAVIDSLNTDKILIITTNGFRNRGYLDSLSKKLQGRISDIVCDVLPNPELEYVEEIKNKYKNYKEIVALGGGSVIDTAKYFSVIGSINKENNTLKPDCNSYFIPIYAIPTTAGTSSELTKWATVWDKKNNIKFSLDNINLYCKEAFYDPKIFLNIPLELTIHTALDSLSHAVESIWNVNSNDISTNHAIKAIELILEYLPSLSQKLDSIELRIKIILASIHAGLAFSNTQTALAHAISYPITMHYGIPHGLACSFTIPTLIECVNNDVIKDILSTYKNDIASLFKKLNISTNLSKYGIDTKFIENIFLNLNSRARNGMFDLEFTKDRFLKSFCET